MFEHVVRMGLALGLMLLAAACARPVVDETPGSDPLFGLGEREVFTVTSNRLGRDFHVLVRLPRSYGDSDRDYPMAFLLDGGILFPMLSPYQLMMEAEGSAGEVVVVGISYGGLGYANGNLRGTDYTAPSPEVEYFGGASEFAAFLDEELLPILQRDYRIDSEQRMLFGQSLGGQFAIHAALTRPDLFATYVAINPALHSNLPYFIALEGREPGTQLVLAMGSEDDPRYRQPALDWLADRRSRAGNVPTLEIIDLPGGHHATSAPAAYGAVVRSLVPPEDDG